MNIIEQARDALAGATPGPWTISARESVSGIGVDDWADDDFSQSNKRLAALAPELAAEVVRLHEQLSTIADWLDEQADENHPLNDDFDGNYFWASRIRDALNGGKK